MVYIDVDLLREENLEGNNEDENTIYIEGTPIKSALMREELFKPNKGLRGTPDYDENLSPDDRNRMETMAKMIDVVYNRRKEYGFNFLNPTNRKAFKRIEGQNVEDYFFHETETDLTGLFVNDQKKEVVLAMRGLLPIHDQKDLFQLPDMIKSTLFEREEPHNFGEQFLEDKMLLFDEYNKIKGQYPDHKIVVTGHSRGGQASIYLGRKHNLEFYAFSPAGNRADYLNSIPSEKGNIYYHTGDPVSMHFHKQKGRTIEQHYESFNKRLYPHSVKDFYDKRTTVFKHPKQDKNEKERMEKAIVADVLAEGQIYIAPEDLVDSDLGNFYFDDLGNYNDEDDPKKQRTTGLTMKDPTDIKIFNEYVPSVFNDLNYKQPKPFRPITFESIDGDKNNKISFTEFKRYFKNIGYDDEDIESLFNTYDVDDDGGLDKKEFNKLIAVL